MPFLPDWLRDWIIPATVGFAPLIGLELHHLQERRRARWSPQRRALRALEATWRR
jgi:hypothetical protein